ncbi:MAG: alpha/beta hydrolase [Chloroflexi bacterium]|nr:alpha/beta hydrolase [Chloroflexota bacterium]
MSLFFKEFGAGNAQTVVLLHGGGGAGWMWQPQIEQLTDFHLLVPDLPEHGQSRASQPFTFVDAAAQVAELIKAEAHGGRAHVVGLSLGAQTIVQLLGQSPDVIDHAVISGALVRAIPGIGLTRLMTQMYWPFKNAVWLIRANMKSLGIPGKYFAEFAADTKAMTLDSFVRVTTANALFRIPPNLDRVTVPTLFLVGQKELKLMHDSLRDSLKAMPSAQGYGVANAIHNWSMQLPDLFTQTVRAWITDRALPTELKPLV